MKNTDINNPDIQVKDKRLMELHKIVMQVKESEEWEVVKMDILDVGIQKGIEQGIERGVKALIETCSEFNITKEEMKDKVMEKFELTEARADEYVRRYWIKAGKK